MRFASKLTAVIFAGFFDDKLVKSTLKECSRMAEFDHPNVLSIIGVCLDAGPLPFIVMPFMFNGNLLSYLKRERDNLCVTFDSTTGSEITTGEITIEISDETTDEIVSVFSYSCIIIEL